MPLRIPARNVGGDQIMESTTNASSREEQHIRISGQVQPTTITGSLTTGTLNVTTSNITQYSGLHVATGGTYATYTLLFEICYDGGPTLWWPISGQQEDNTSPSGSSVALPANALRSWFFYVGGATHFRVRTAAAPASGSALFYIAPVINAPDPAITAVPGAPPGAQIASFTATNAAAGVGTTEAFVQLAASRNLAAPSAAANTQTVTAGKTFRPLGLVFSHIVGTAAVIRATWSLRAVLTGTATATSPVVAAGITVNTVATTGTPAPSYSVPLLPDLPGGTSFALTNVLNAASAGTTSTATLYGYEY